MIADISSYHTDVCSTLFILPQFKYVIEHSSITGERRRCVRCARQWKFTDISSEIQTSADEDKRRAKLMAF